MADELISRQALMRNFCGYDLNECVKYGNKTAEQQNNSYSTMMMYEIANEIEDAPAVDAVEVVRCKDCKHYKRGIVFKDTMFCFRPDENGGPYVIRSKDDNFCSYGERREENAAD